MFLHVWLMNARTAKYISLYIYIQKLNILSLYFTLKIPEFVYLCAKFIAFKYLLITFLIGA